MNSCQNFINARQKFLSPRNTFVKRNFMHLVLCKHYAIHARDDGHYS